MQHEPAPPARLVMALLVALSACDDPGPVDRIRFREPERVEVVAGERIADVAAAHEVDPDALRRWNGLDGDTIPADATLLVWKVPEVEPLDPVEVADAPPPPRPRAARRAPPAPEAGQVVITEGAVVVGAAAGENPDARVAIEPPSSVRTAGVLSALGAIDEGGADLEESVAALRVRGDAPGQAGLRDGSALAAGPSADTLTDVGRTPRAWVGPDVGAGPIRPPRLPMPAPKPCLAGPSADSLQADEGWAGHQGLTPEQIGAAMRAFVPKTMSCVPAGTKGSYEVETQVKVGCDGRVMDVWIIDSALPDAVADCIAAALRHAPFPAHAMPDGLVFAYPIVYRY